MIPQKNNVLCKASRSCLKALRSIFSRSSQRTGILIRKQKQFNEPVLKTKSHYAVRWEAEETLVKMAISCPKAIKAALEEILEQTNVGMKTFLKIQKVLNLLDTFANRAMLALQSLVFKATHKVFMKFEAN